MVVLMAHLPGFIPSVAQPPSAVFGATTGRGFMLGATTGRGFMFGATAGRGFMYRGDPVSR
jgi:hypothetical protein